MRKLSFITLVVLAMLVISCNRDLSENNEKEPHTLEEIEVPEDFDWRTYNNVSFELKGGFNSLIEIASVSGKTVYHRAYLEKDKTLNVTVPIPNFETEVKIRYMGKEVVLDLNGSILTQEF